MRAGLHSHTCTYRYTSHHVSLFSMYGEKPATSRQPACRQLALAAFTPNSELHQNTVGLVIVRLADSPKIDITALSSSQLQLPEKSVLVTSYRENYCSRTAGGLVENEWETQRFCRSCGFYVIYTNVKHRPRWHTKVPIMLITWGASPCAKKHNLLVGPVKICFASGFWPSWLVSQKVHFGSCCR